MRQTGYWNPKCTNILALFQHNQPKISGDEMWQRNWRKYERCMLRRNVILAQKNDFLSLYIRDRWSDGNINAVQSQFCIYSYKRRPFYLGECVSVPVAETRMLITHKASLPTQRTISAPGILEPEDSSGWHEEEPLNWN
jgi:hypothetical protein